MGDAREVTITVRGEHTERIAPEEAVAHLVVRAESPERRRAIELLSARSAPVGADLTARQAQGMLASWSSERILVWSEEQRPPEGRRRTILHHASVAFVAVFRDAAALSAWLGEVGEREGVEVGETRWRLSPATAMRLGADVAAHAVQVAVERATAYATAIGCTTIVPVEIADAGMLGPADGSGTPQLLRAAATSDTSPFPSLRPEDITVSATIEARFVAS